VSASSSGTTFNPSTGIRYSVKIELPSMNTLGTKSMIYGSDTTKGNLIKFSECKNGDFKLSTQKYNDFMSLDTLIFDSPTVATRSLI